MEPIRRILQTYLSSSGKDFFGDWLIGLKDRKARAIIAARLDRLSIGQLGEYRSVFHGVLELKIHYGPGYRIYFGLDGMTVVILLCGGDKSTQAKDIRKAHQYWADYKSQL